MDSDDRHIIKGMVDCENCRHLDSRWRGLKMFLICEVPGKPRAVIDLIRTQRDNLTTIRPNCNPEQELLTASLSVNDSVEEYKKARI